MDKRYPLLLAITLALGGHAMAATDTQFAPGNISRATETIGQPHEFIVPVRERGGGQRAAGGGQRGGGGNFNSNNFNRDVSNSSNTNVNRNANVNASRNVNVSGGCCDGDYDDGPSWGGVAAGVAVGAVVGAAVAQPSTYPAPPPTYPPGYATPPPY
jgi:hypothetical protein